jgi:hypothetical protein
MLVPGVDEGGAINSSRGELTESDARGQSMDVPITYPVATPPTRTSHVAVVRHPGSSQRLFRIETRLDWLPIPLCPWRFVAHGDPLFIASPITVLTRAA